MRLAAKTLLACALAGTVGGCSTVRGVMGLSNASYPVFFTPFSANLESSALGTISQAAQKARDNPDARVVVMGYAAPPGSAKVNLDLSRTRAQIVSDTLVADGVPKGRITQHAKGEVDYTLDPVEARRVEISVGG